MGANKTFQQKHGEHVILGESSEFRRLRHAVEKAAGDRERAIRNVCRLYGVKTSTRCQVRSGRRRWLFSTPEFPHDRTRGSATRKQRGRRAQGRSCSVTPKPLG